MNKKGQKAALGFAFLVVAFILFLVLFATLEPFKEFLDDARDTTSLNCPGTLSFNQTDYDDDNTLEKLTRRPTCAVTGFSLLYFFITVMVGIILWTVNAWRKI